MKSLNDKRDELWKNRTYIFDDEEEHGRWLKSICELNFKAGWDDCAEEYEKLNRLLKKQLEIVTKVLAERCCIDDCGFDVENEDIEILRGCMKAIDFEARKALKEIESAGE